VTDRNDPRIRALIVELAESAPLPPSYEELEEMLEDRVSLSDTFEPDEGELIMVDIQSREAGSEQEGRRSWARLAILSAAAAVIVVVAVALFNDADETTEIDAASQGGDTTPAAVIAEYLVVFNAEDAEAVMVFYAEDIVIEGHPLDPDGISTGKSEVLAIEQLLDGFQGSTGTMEYINLEVSGDTVTFDNISVSADGECFSSAGSVATIENDLITLIVWGDQEADLC
jgi:ketosteroid isomerase-like protein